MGRLSEFGKNISWREVFAGVLVGLIIGGFLSPWISLTATHFYTPWAPTYGTPDIEFDLYKETGEIERRVLKNSNLTNSDSIDVYHVEIDNEANVTANDIDIFFQFPGCVLHSDMSLNEDLGIDDFVINNYSSVSIGGAEQFDIYSCSKHINIDELGPNDIIHLNYVTTNRFDRCDVLKGPVFRPEYHIDYQWTTHGHILKQPLEARPLPELEQEFSSFKRNVDINNATTYQNGSTRLVLVAFDKDYAAKTLYEFDIALEMSNC